MLMMTAAPLRRLFGGTKKREPQRRPVPGNTTQTLRALSDLGESVAAGVHVIYSPVRLYLCVSMEPKPEALRAQAEEDRRIAAGMFEVDELWSAAAVNARWARRAVLTDGEGCVLHGAMSGARGMTDAGAREVFFEFNALDTYPDKMYLSDGETRVRVK